MHQDENNWISSSMGGLEDSGIGSLCGVIQLAGFIVTFDYCGCAVP